GLRLRAGQPGNARAHVWRGADHRLDRGSRAVTPGAAARRHGRAGARRCAALSRQARLGYRISHQGNGARGEEGLSRRIMLAAVLTFAYVATAPAASSIQPIVSPGGIKAWLVREQTVPMVAIDYAFSGGVNGDPADKPGVANMVSSMLDEGAGELDAR